MLRIQQVKRLALQNAQGSRAEGFYAGVGGSCWVGVGGSPGGLRLSAGVAFGALEVVLGVLIYRQA